MFYKPKVTHYTVDEARQRIENYCAYRERCHSEVVAKLREMGMIEQAINQIVSELIASNYLNEQRFAIQFSLGKFRIKKWGKLRIERELKSRNLSAFTIKKALEAMEKEGYEKKFVEVFSKKLELLSSIPASQKQQKLIRYLQYRGWENELIFEHIKQIR
ncbi:MAG: regulatory protein RecX [Bacteroidetes bacterium]|nr:regulatory protein RecX [Bacteroidota bacterium]